MFDNKFEPGEIFEKPFLQLAPFDKITLIAFYLTVAVIALGLIMFVLVKIFNKDKVKDFQKSAGVFAIGYITAFFAILLTLSIGDMVESGGINKMVFIPIITIIGIAVLLIIAGMVIHYAAPSSMRIFKIVAFSLIGAAIIAAIAVLSVYAVQIKDESPVENAGLIIGVIVLIGILLLASFVFSKKRPATDDTRSIAYAAISIALAFALSYIRLFRLPQGGSVTFASLLPLMLYSYMFGMRKGITAGFIYGVLQAIQDPYIIHPAQFLLDYPIAFAMIGLTALFKELKLFKNKPIIGFILGGIVAATFRYLSHALSGMFAFASYAPEGINAVAWGFLYNLFVYFDIAVALVAGGLCLASSKELRARILAG